MARRRRAARKSQGNSASKSLQSVSQAISDDDRSDRSDSSYTDPFAEKRQGARSGQFLSFMVDLSGTLIALIVFTAVLAKSEDAKALVLYAAGTLAAIVIPATYIVAGSMRYRKRWSNFQPFQGGARFVVLQAFSWIFFSLGLVTPPMILIAGYFHTRSVLEVILIVSGTSFAISQSMMISSLLNFYTMVPESVPEPTKRDQRQRSKSEPALTGDAAAAWWIPFMRMQIGLAFLGGAYCILSEFCFHEDNWMIVLVGISSIACLTTSVFITHGVGGAIRYNHMYRKTPGAPGWTFFQPGLGGATFVVVQGFAWTLYAAVMLMLLYHTCAAFLTATQGRILLGRLQSLEAAWGGGVPSLGGAGATGVLVEVLMAASLLVFKSPAKPAPKPPRLSDPTPPPPTITLASFSDHEVQSHKGLVHCLQTLRRVAMLSIFYNIPNILICANLSLIMVGCTYPLVVSALWSLSFALYLPTFLGKPSITGIRTLSGKSMLYYRWLVNDARRYFRFRLCKPAHVTLSPSHRHVFGYHPHGIIPMGSVWYHHTPEWEELFPGIRPSTLISSVVHTIPVLRDLCQWLRAREVSRRGFRAALAAERSVLLVPGGQLEMIDSSSYTNVSTVVTSHTGFIRLAMELAAEEDSGAAPLQLVPVFGFGEEDLLDNVPTPREVQRWFMKRIRANIMFLPYGALNLPGIPRPACLSVAVGEPIPVPSVAAPSKAQISLLHRRYFTALQELFNANKAHAGHAGDQIRLDPPIEPLPAEQWERAWREQCRAEGKPAGLPQPATDPATPAGRLASSLSRNLPDVGIKEPVPQKHGIDGEEVFIFVVFMGFLAVGAIYGEYHIHWRSVLSSLSWFTDAG